MQNVAQPINATIARTIAQNMLDRKPCGILIFQWDSNSLELIAAQMNFLRPTLTQEDHLQAIYEYILACSNFSRQQLDQLLNCSASAPNISEQELYEKSRECLSEDFFHYFDRQILSMLGQVDEPYISWLKPKLLLKATLHITLHHCEPCRNELAQRKGPAMYAQAYFNHPGVDHDYSGRFFQVH